MKILINIFKHIFRVFKHKFYVFKYCCKMGIPWQGFMHDWSKFSPIEFFESIKYYQNGRSPIDVIKQIQGRSLENEARNRQKEQKAVMADHCSCSSRCSCRCAAGYLLVRFVRRWKLCRCRYQQRSVLERRQRNIC